MNSIFSYPKWEDIPNIDLYLDQVLLYVNQVCAPISPDKDKGLTASMVNNYVKHGYLTKPDKKKYQRKQIARLIAITTLKSVFSIQEIAQTLNTLQTQASSDQLYDAFVDYMNHGIDPENPIIQTSCQTVKLYHQTLDLILIKEEEEIQ
ncbi:MULTISPECIES: DUF1836 domain-containing protein [Streptococcus]|jgi:hypothetical protein|uniref:DUF1836 domain-containing protein n=1 Tax=Streptococcus oralis subsp. oralis TaxID=1891914 RepID=A0A1X1IKQ8_STROR|nr:MULTISPECIES: DUF1836 domain-containing protein [Streptococcus]ANR75580.1 hypothetical protein AXF18_06505 [Streptococcus sp. oral taxon 064]EIC77259.1 PF08876 domain protein [Streptococcus oralis SK100]KZX08568.1 hypothetical protein A4224_00230 [Streptococcus oralis]MBA1351531.1 DUF1836 domain-containing protein [Streptococcus oralis subsp. oralis]MBK3298109.1 DUF1836 domain-containing protein [Streptococcus oralis]